MLKTASKPVDVQDLQFKLQCRLKISDSKEGILSETPLALIASASRYGLVFVGCISSKLKVFRFESFEESSSTELTTNYASREINLTSQPYYICVNCDHTILGVVCEKDNGLVVLFYDIPSFYKENIVLLNEIRLSTTPGIHILQANWHPTMNNIYTVCRSDGSLGIYELQNNSFDVKNLPRESKSSCFCWSPKGKQIAVGSQDGKIFHYKPDLKAVKTIEAPSFDKPHGILSLQWISNYQFIGVFKTCYESEPEYSVILIDAPKTGNPIFTNFNDICYSNGNLRPSQFFMIAEQNWNILLVASANSMEVGVLSNAGETWTQCILPDSARAELPLDKNQDETYPIGMTIDTSSAKPVLWGESYLQPAPSLLLLSHEGVLCCFKMINLKEGAVNFNSPPEKINDMSGLKYFTTSLEHAARTSTKNALETFHPEKDANLTTATVVPTTNPNSHDMFPLANSTLLGTNQGLQTPTRPLSFGAAISRQSLSSQSTNLISDGVSITPVTKKEPALPTSAASKGALLLSNIIPEKAYEGSIQRKEANQLAEKNSRESRTFSNIFASASAATNINTTFKNRENSEGSIETNSNTSNKNEGVHSSVGPTILSAVSKAATLRSSGSNQIEQSNISIDKSTTTQNVCSDSQKTNENSNIGSLVTNPIQLQASGGMEKNGNEEEGLEMKNMLTKMLQMERAALDKEIRELLVQGQHLRMNLKSEEMDKVVNSTENIQDFLKDLIETCEIQNSEVHILKQNTIQAWAWMEEARSRLKECQNEELRSVIKSKPLDSVSEKHLITLKQMQFYLNSQLTQSHKVLDDQWDKFQDFCRKTNRVQLPTMEAIFQTMVKQDAVLQKHNYILNDIKSQIKGKQKVSNEAALFIPLGRNDDFESSFQNIKSDAESIYHIYHQKILNRVKLLPKQKSNQLRRILHNREVPHVMVKSQRSKAEVNSSMTSNQRTSMSLETPVGKKTGSSNLFQSSPLNISSDISSQISSTPLAATNNIILGGKPELLTRIGSNLQKGLASSISESNTETVPVKHTNMTNFTFSNKKQSPFLPNQKTLLETTTTAMNEIDLNILSKPIDQESHQNIQRSRFLVTSNSQTQELVIEPTVPSSSATTNIQSGTPNKIFSFISSATSLPNFTSSATTAFPSTITTDNGTSSGGSLRITTNTSPSTVSEIVISNPSITSTFASGKTTSLQPADTTRSGFSTSTSNFLGSNFPFIKNEPFSSTQSLFSKNTGPAVFGSLSTNNEICPKSDTSGLASRNGNSNLVLKSKTSSQATPTNSPIFGDKNETSEDSIKNHFSFVTPGTENDRPLSICTNPSSTSTSSVLKNTMSIFQNCTRSSEILSTHLKSSHFDNNAKSPESVQTTAPSSFDPFSNKENLSTSGSSIFAPNSKNSFFTNAGSLNGTSSISTTVNDITGKTSTCGQVTDTFVSLSTINNSVPTTTIFTSNPSIPNIGQALSVSKISSTNSHTVQASTLNTSVSVYQETPVTNHSLLANTSICDKIVPTTHAMVGTSRTSEEIVTSAPKSIFSTSKTSDEAVSLISKPIFGNTGGSVSMSKTVSTLTATSNFNTTSNSSEFTTSSSGDVNATTTASVFGNPASLTAPFNDSVKSVFAPLSSESSPFNVSGVPVQSLQFNDPFSNVNSSKSPFGQASSVPPPFCTSSVATSPFSGVTTNVQSSLFGAKPSINSPFGAVTPSVSSPFGIAQEYKTGFDPNTSIQASPFDKVSTGSNAFGPSSKSDSVFGTVNSTESSSSQVGQISNASTGMFGPFGSSSAKNAEASFGFGNLNMGLSSQSSFVKTNETKSPFRGTTFNPTSSTGSLFGSSTLGNNNGNSIFGQSTFGNSSAFGVTQQSGPFSAGAGSIAQTGFGVSQTSEKTTAFGAAPTFGGTPAFGSAPTFGGAPTFGSTSSFGSPNKIFGSPNPSPAASVFGSSNQQSTGFGSFANQNSLGFGNLAQPINPGETQKQSSGFETFASQNTIGFGSLAQQTMNSGQNAPFSGNSSFSSWR